MPHTASPPSLLSRWRLPVLGVAIVAIVVGPFLIMRSAIGEAHSATEKVMHTREVESLMQTVAADARSLEAAAMTRARGIDSPVLRQRIDEANARILPNLEAVLALTRDNPEQQARLGALRSNLEQRLARIDAVTRAAEAATDDQIDNMVVLNPIQRLITDIVEEEQQLLDARVESAERANRNADIARWTSMLVQLALLLGASYFALREQSGRRQAEGLAARASNRSALVLDSVREPIVLIDRDQRVVMYNAAFAELYAADDVEIRGERLAAVGEGAWDHAETLRRLHDVLARNRELWDHRINQSTTDGIERTMLVNARRMPLPDRDDPVVLVTASDVTAQTISERQIRELNQQLEGKVEQVSDVNRELEAFSYSVSHDLRAPLRHIAGFADKLGRHLGTEVDEKTTHYLGVIGGSARRMSALIDDLLVYSRLGRSALRLQSVDLQSMVADTRAMLDSNSAAEHPGHRIEWKVTPLPIVVGDENMLRQVWLNLLGNAVKYSTGSEPAQIEVDCRRGDDGGYQFSVRDNGAGFDMQYAGKLFGVFQRLHSATEFPGTGVGLASVRRVLGRHGGRIWAEAEPGKGATFHFTLPASVVDAGPSSSPGHSLT
ncbi:ATP-binding protein [Luteimonas sp. 3794]|uniref:sensor histidine kinase n=1 Tax=Luteimonas sp. 3794 TaxID=2817730 RepID=UPI002858FA72|nr:ATP-binding protein [Luteimonas sp. 3794]MDR6990482.1 PAS domain S-box-containing protein [Luteimonas sp. 3794]